MSRSPGAKRLLAALFLAASAAAAESPPEFASAEKAIAARAWQDAARIWEREAESGRAEAYLGLGNLWDLGVLGARDQAKALDYYRKAAEGGLPAAAFNVGAIMAGRGTRSDTETAAVWYARAAMNGHDRAAYALGQLFANGNAVPRNPALAAEWLKQAARTIPAAETSLASLGPPLTGNLNAPIPLMFELGNQDGERWAQAAWAASPGPQGATYRLEIMGKDERGNSGPAVRSFQTGNGAARVKLPNVGGATVWRVIMVDEAGADYAPSPWLDPQQHPVSMKSTGTVRFRNAADGEQVRTAVRKAASSLASSGLHVSIDETSKKATVSTVRYRFAADAALARDIAVFLPAMNSANVQRDRDLDAGPGEVVVELAFD